MGQGGGEGELPDPSRLPLRRVASSEGVEDLLTVDDHAAVALVRDCVEALQELLEIAELPLAVEAGVAFGEPLQHILGPEPGRGAEGGEDVGERVDFLDGLQLVDGGEPWRGRRSPSPRRR
ncbi:hypothetical protein [Streptomyces ipomoeae]|uniref:hypothetical protein n=1 Tax=Streptomyces ipomoeae TaxID=103232 RepID=UPI0011467827|nr:hypothetical protein [Streptomyces ipomoeae]MDX2933041.1 hypothetical protein [Streptomyces ipomoeae]TQE16547.1 hypothetical protein SipoB123_40625 [Streptomyces ipomoeae]